MCDLAIERDNEELKKAAEKSLWMDCLLKHLPPQEPDDGKIMERLISMLTQKSLEEYSKDMGNKELKEQYEFFSFYCAPIEIDNGDVWPWFAYEDARELAQEDFKAVAGYYYDFGVSR